MPIYLRGFLPDTLTKKDILLYLIISGFFITLYLPKMPVINNIFIGTLVFYSFFYNSFSEKVQLIRERPSVQWMFLFFILHVVSFFLSHNRHEAGALLQMRIPLLLFPMSVGLISINQLLKEKILVTYCFVTTLAAFICLLTAFISFQRTGDASLLYNDSLSRTIGKQSIYFALLINVAVAGFVWLLYSAPAILKHKIIVYISLAILLIAHFMLASRIGITILYSSFLILALYYIIKKKKIFQGITFVLILACGVLMMVNFLPKTVNRFRELMYTSYEYGRVAPESHYNMEVTSDQWNGANIRLAIWSCGWQLSREYLYTGAQLGDKQDKLMEIYRARNFSFAYATKRDMHNTYLDVLSTFGIAGLIVFLLGYILLPAILCIRNQNILGVFVIAAFSISIITESYLDTSLGNVMLCFFIPFIIASQKRSQN